MPSGAGLPDRWCRQPRAGRRPNAGRLGHWLHGGSFAFAVAPERSETGGAMLVSGPQLGYSYPTQLWEMEVHGGGYDARGSTVPACRRSASATASASPGG